ncbi:MAG: hypothetical protein GY699_02755 [Desulfobacteraceae bacterium]|nr:hypothetical protein [Desulfobacteraceae bacterium]
MDFLRWFLENFGIFFGSVFLFYFFLMIRRLVVLYDYLRDVPKGENETVLEKTGLNSLSFLSSLFQRLEKSSKSQETYSSFVVDAIWAEIDCRISVHFQAISGYVSTLVLIGFAGTIFGSIGAFNEMFQGLASGKNAAVVFAASWDKGLSTALYTSLGAAAIGGVVLTLIGSRFLLTRAKRLEAMVSLKICQILERGAQ